MRRRALALAALTLVAAQPSQDPYEQGVAARHAGDAARAVELLSQVVAAEPENSDAQLQLGLALMAAGRLEEAEAALRRTLALAPGYDDARIALARIAQRRGDPATGLRELEPVNPANAKAARLRTSLAAAPEEPSDRWQLDVEGNYSALDGGRSDWREGSLQLRYQATPETAVSARLESSHRFGLDDTYGEFRLDHRISPAAGVYAALGATPNADFRPEWQVSAGAAVRVRSGPEATVLTLDARQARYRAGDIQTLSPGIEQYVVGGRVWLTGRLINIFDEQGEHHLGWLARGDAQAAPRLRLFAGLSDAPDTSEGRVVDTFSVFGGLSLDVNGRTTFRLSLAHENREFGADRLQSGIGLGLRF